MTPAATSAGSGGLSRAWNTAPRTAPDQEPEANLERAQPEQAEEGTLMIAVRNGSSGP